MKMVLIYLTLCLSTIQPDGFRPSKLASILISKQAAAHIRVEGEQMDSTEEPVPYVFEN